ncbi:MAG: class II glutamine amidotransferase [Candidatus Ranarchaeia archaeon]
MKKISFAEPPHNSIGKRNHDACGIAGFINLDGERQDGSLARTMIKTIIDRENGLGGGFAAYGLFPDRKEEYCFQVLFDNMVAKKQVNELLTKKTIIKSDEEVETFPNGSIQPPTPIIWRFFIDPPTESKLKLHDNYVVDLVMEINTQIKGAFCISSGKNMAVFKGNGWAHEVADFYKIQNYKAYIWLAHSRFPTNTPGWWGGAHPFNILDWSVVHNGEITSYGTNKRFLEMKGYECTLQTDTEVVAYLWDLLVRKCSTPIPMAALALAPPYYSEVEYMPERSKEIITALRSTYSPAMLNGPFSILVGTNRPTPTIIGLTDRKKLRPLICAEAKDNKTLFLSSEEAAIRSTGREIDDVWAPIAGRPVVASLGEGILLRGTESPTETIQVQ